ncbi:hypothetical protein CSOJ01_03375 [Colletotrichum sojae]|uniref:Uncharacterized protein n=1 Tax=Colletotrichum sojae TaxID=2175907 RepID=A0A8H6JMF0_9PEZI|nr:hypothetical protein CSOJ01_03375 [Colletotrichum sojae]
MPSNARLFCSRESALNAMPALRFAAAAAALPLLPAPASSDDREARPVASSTGCRKYGWDVPRLKGSKTPPIATLPSPPLHGHEGWNWRKRDIGSRITMDMNAAPGAVEEYVGSMARPQAPRTSLTTPSLSFEMRGQKPSGAAGSSQLDATRRSSKSGTRRQNSSPVVGGEAAPMPRDEFTAHYAIGPNEGTTTETVQVVERNYEDTTLAKETESALRGHGAANHHHAARPKN